MKKAVEIELYVIHGRVLKGIGSRLELDESMTDLR